MIELTSFTRERIARACDDALRRAGVVGVLPTPLDAVRDALGIYESDAAPGGVAGVLGALWFDERMLFVERRQSRVRQRFTAAHELAHAVCPWHEAVLRLDTSAELFDGVAKGVEAEANLGAGQILFQGSTFALEAQSHGSSLITPFALAGRYGTSRQAAAHQYVETHAGVVAMLVAGRWPGPDGCLPIWRSIESGAFRERYGSFARSLSGGLAVRDAEGAQLAAAIEGARTSSGPVEAVVTLLDRGGRARRFSAEVVNNRHCHLVFVAEQSRRLAQRRGASAGRVASGAQAGT
jgi:hypothetical protein